MKSYGRTRAVDGLDLTVERGSIYGLLGPNGSGKTTTLGCAIGLLRPSAGTIEVLGVPAGRVWATRGRVGCVFDADALVPNLTARSNLEYARRLLGHGGGRTIDEALARVGMERLAGRRAGRLSLGEKKRLSIARALLGRPELLVCDEPLSGLDALGVREMLRLYRELASEGLTIVLSSHRLAEMERVVTHAGVILGGRLVREGPLASLLDEGRGGARVRVDDVERARAALAGAFACESAGDGELRVALEGKPASELNRVLVGAGVGVSRLVADRADLQTLFETLADRAAEARA